MKKKCIIKVVTGIGNQGQLPWLATLVTKVTTMVTTMVTMMVTTMVTITNLGYRGCVTDYYKEAFQKFCRACHLPKCKPAVRFPGRGTSNILLSYDMT